MDDDFVHSYMSPDRAWINANCIYLLTHFFLTLDSDNNGVFLALYSLLLLGYGFYEERPLFIKIFAFWLISFPFFYPKMDWESLSKNESTDKANDKSK